MHPAVVEHYFHHEIEELNIKLKYLGEYRGTKISMLERGVKEDNRCAAKEIPG